MISLDPPVKHLLVDLDGTLLANKSIPLSFDFVQRSIGILKSYGGVRKAMRVLYEIQEAFKKPSPDFTNDQRVIDLVSRRMNVSIEEARQILREGLMVLFPNLKKHFYPVEGAKEFLDWAKDRYPMTLTTNPVWPPEIVEMRVQWAGIDPKIFGAITHVRLMHACKPEPLYYEEVLKMRDLKPEDALLIGDEVKMDLPATRLGIRTFIVGPYRNVTRLRLKGMQAPAWRGTYADLRKILEGQPVAVNPEEVSPIPSR